MLLTLTVTVQVAFVWEAHVARAASPSTAGVHPLLSGDLPLLPQLSDARAELGARRGGSHGLSMPIRHTVTFHVALVMEAKVTKLASKFGERVLHHALVFFGLLVRSQPSATGEAQVAVMAMIPLSGFVLRDPGCLCFGVTSGIVGSGIPYSGGRCTDVCLVVFDHLLAVPIFIVRIVCEAKVLLGLNGHGLELLSRQVETADDAFG
jgi:hypothetical protein